MHVLATGIFEAREETEVAIDTRNGFELTSLNLQREVLTMSIRQEKVTNGRRLHTMTVDNGGGSGRHDLNKEKTSVTYNWIRESHPKQKIEEFFFKCEVEHLV